MDIQKRIFEAQDIKYRDFQLKLTPGLTAEYMIGVRTPELKKIAGELIKDGSADSFIAELPHRYFEENQIHAFILSEMKDYERLTGELERFLPCIDNWATCDQLRPKIFRKHTDDVYQKIKQWINSDHTYTIRFGLGMLMAYFLDEKFTPEQHELAVNIVSDEYYVNMMRAWYFATALAKQYDDTAAIFESRRLDRWTHNKSIQKARESFRVSDEHKAFLSTLKVTGNKPENRFRTVNLSRKQVTDIYRKYMKKDFPKDELKPLPMILKSLDDGIYSCIGLECDGKICGYAYFVCLGTYTLLDYFAVIPEKRGIGYGSEFLRLLSDFFSRYSMVLVESENPEYAEDEDDRIKRLRRIDFYIRNGFRDTGARALLFGVRYVLLEPEISVHHDIKEICSAYLGHYRAVLPEKMFAENVAVE